MNREQQLVVLVVGVLSSVFFCRASQADVKQVDRRNASEATSYYLTFCARSGMPGHAFVVWGREDPTMGACVMHAYGMWPAKNAIAIGEVPGRIVDEATTGSLAATTDRLIVRVNSDAFERAEAVRENWLGRDYELTSSVCVTFTAEVSQAIGLEVPQRWKALLPQAFIRALMRIND